MKCRFNRGAWIAGSRHTNDACGGPGNAIHLGVLFSCCVLVLVQILEHLSVDQDKRFVFIPKKMPVNVVFRM